MTNDMIQLLVNTDQNLLLYLNGFHNAFGDYFMSTFTGKWIWVPMYASILYVLLKNFNWKITLCCLTAIALGRGPRRLPAWLGYAALAVYAVFLATVFFGLPL